MKTSTDPQKRVSPKPVYDKGRPRRWLRSEQQDLRRRSASTERRWGRDR